MRRPLLWILLLALGLAMVAFVARHDEATLGQIAGEEFAVLVAKVGIQIGRAHV